MKITSQVKNPEMIKAIIGRILFLPFIKESIEIVTVNAIKIRDIVADTKNIDMNV